MTTERVLCVDDDANILAAYQRTLKKQFDIDIAEGGCAGLEALASRGPYAVIVSDMRMPGMDGIQFLSKARESAPDSVRMMLTGNNDLRTAMEAVNEGNIYRFLTKPCPPAVLAYALESGIQQYRLIYAERELLEKTLNGSIRVLTEILSIIDPQSFGRGERLRELIRPVAEKLRIPDTWALEVAAMLSQIGLITVPAAVSAKARAGHSLSSMEKEMLLRVPEVGRKLLANIPRLEKIAQIVHYQNKRFDGSGFPSNEVAGDDIPIGARILKVLSDLTQITDGDSTQAQRALHLMHQRQGWYDPMVLQHVTELFAPRRHDSAAARPRRSIALPDLKVDDILLSDLVTRDGLLVLSAGHRISEAFYLRILNIAAVHGIQEPIDVEVPKADL